MDTCEPIRIACPKCGSRYRIRSESIFNLARTSCSRCKQVLELSPERLRTKPVREADILDWLRMADRDEL